MARLVMCNNPPCAKCLIDELPSKRCLLNKPKGILWRFNITETKGKVEEPTKCTEEMKHIGKWPPPTVESLRGSPLSLRKSKSKENANLTAAQRGCLGFCPFNAYGDEFGVLLLHGDIKVACVAGISHARTWLPS